MTASSVSTRLIAKIFFVVVGLAALCYLVYLSRAAIGLVLLAAFLAIALGPAVDFFDKRIRTPRWLAILIVYVISGGLIVLVGLLVVPPIATGVKELAIDIPEQLNRLQRAGWIHDLNQRYGVVDKLKVSAADLPSQLGSAAGTLQSITFGAFSAFVQLLVVLTLVFLMLLDGPRLVTWALDQMHGEQLVRAQRIVDEIYRVISGYVLGNVLISVAAGTVTYITLSLLDVPFAAPLSLLMAFLDLIPLVGASIAGGLIALAAAALGDFPLDPIVWLVVLTAYQQVENNMLQPVIYKRTISVHPLLTIIAVIIGASLLGVLGALLAIPVAAMAQIAAKDMWAIAQLKRMPAAAAAAET